MCLSPLHRIACGVPALILSHAYYNSGAATAVVLSLLHMTGRSVHLQVPQAGDPQNLASVWSECLEFFLRKFCSFSSHHHHPSFLFLLCFFEAGYHYVAQVSLTLLILHHPPNC